MNAAQVLDHFDRISDAPDAIPRLRRFILDLAVRGKLVEQDPNDEPVSELLKRIHQHKVQCESRRRGNNTKITFAAFEGPFRIPSSWMWMPFGDLMISRDGERIPVSQDERNRRAKIYEYYGASGVIDQIDSYLFDKPLLLIGEDGANLINRSTPIAFIAHGKYWVNNHAHVLDGISENLLRYIQLYINAIDLKPYVTGTAQPKMNQAKMNSILIALPPEAEQDRIVAKVDELMALCDRLEAAQTERDSRRDKLAAASLHRLNNGADADEFREHARFHLHNLPRLTTRPEHIQQLRQTILNLAVRGKLVPQDPNDEPASDLLASVADQKTRTGNTKTGRDWVGDITSLVEEAFDSPPGWMWTRIADAVERVTVGYVGPMKDQYVEGGIPFLRSQNVRANRFSEDGLISISPKFHQTIAKSALSPGDVVVVRSGNVGTACVIPPSLPVSNCSDLVVVKQPIAVVATYLCFYLNSLAAAHIKAGAVGVALTHFNTKSVATMPLPLPPLAEQYRIVEKVDELMALLDKVESQLTTTQTESRRLLEAVLHDALSWRT